MKDWKTTAAGLLGGAFYAAVTAIQAGTIEPKDIALAAALGALGYLARDKKKAEVKTP